MVSSTIRPLETNKVPVLKQYSPPPDYQLESSLEEDLLSLPEIQEAPPRLEWLLQELTSLRLALSQDDSESSAQADWLALCSRLDVFLFRFYLFILALYAGTLLLLWASWSFA